MTRISVLLLSHWSSTMDPSVQERRRKCPRWSWTPIGRKMIENVTFAPISRKDCIWNTGKSSKLCVFIINAVRFQKRLKLFWWIPFLLISCYAVIFHVWANNFKIEKRVQIFKLHACQAPKQFWRQTKCCSAKFSSFVGTWGFVIAFPFRYRSSQFVLIWNFLMHDDHNFSLLLLKFFVDKMLSLNNSFACKSP